MHTVNPFSVFKAISRETANQSPAVWYQFLWHNKRKPLKQLASLQTNPLIPTTKGYTTFPERAMEGLWIKKMGAFGQCTKSIAMQSNIVYETVKEGLWGISSHGIHSVTCNSVFFSLYIKSHWSCTKEQLQIRSTKTPLWELQSELMSIDTHSHTVFFPGLSWAVVHTSQ